MPRCYHCGGEIVFRKDNFGSSYPIHLSGGCFGQSSSRDYELPSDEPDCWKTRCPKCRAAVWFVRHNGGSVWLDDLGRPWPKHPCFDEAESPAAATLRRWISALPDKARANAVLAIASRSREIQIQVGEAASRSTYIELVPLGAAAFAVRVRSSLAVKRGELLCWMQAANANAGQIVFPGGQVVEAEIVPSQVFDLLTTSRPRKEVARALVACPYCKVQVRDTRLRRHLTKCPAR